ncbi:MAG: F0F1 ATP synthase subunit epsilon [Bacillota bacterium]
MAEGSLTLRIITPEGANPQVEADYVVLPGADGYIGILPRHISLVLALKAGVLSYREAGKDAGSEMEMVAVSGGFAEVSDDVITVLADTAEYAEQVDVERAREALRRAEERLSRSSTDIDAVRARAALERAMTRLRAAGENERRGTDD